MSRFVAQKTPQFFATMETLSEAYKEFYESECPIDAFPKAIRDVARTYSVGRNLPMELLCFCACGILSGAMGRVFKARNAVSGGYTQNANIFVLGVGESSTGKSASIRALFSNLERRVLGEISEYQRELAKFKKTKTKRMQDELNGEENLDFEDEISDSPKPPRNPDFIVKNSTSEAMIKAMEASGGEIFSVCEEARDSIYIVAGNYRKQGDDTETLNSGWCGEPIKHNRIVNGISSVPNPCISLLWMVQNDVIDNIENDFIKRDGLQVTIHYDPIVTTDAAVGVLRTRLMEKARQLDPCLSIHDLRIVPGDTHTNVLFDLEFPAGYTGNKDEMLAAMCQFVHEQDPKYSCVVKVEQSYASAAHEK